ncbi:hypothetical protein H9X78_08540, partial [Clostridium saudiense]|nr:hypothetical protein [Clostridium saudiense]
MEKSDILKVNKLVFEYILNLDELELKQLLNGIKVLSLKDGQVMKDKRICNKEGETNKLKSSKRKS